MKAYLTQKSHNILPAVPYGALLTLLVVAAACTAQSPMVGTSSAPARDSLVATGAATEPHALSIRWSADQETGDISQWAGPAGEDGGFQNSGTGIGRITTDVARSGRYALELTISNADGTHGNQAVRLFRVKESRIYAEAYYSAWYYFPQRYVPAAWWNVFQFKSRNHTRNDAFWQINVGNRPDTGNMYFYLTSWSTNAEYTQEIVDIPLGQWVHVEVYYKISGQHDGAIKVWQNNALIFDKAGIQTTFADAIETNWSVNNYTDNIVPSTATIYIDDALISTSRLDTNLPTYLPLIVSVFRNFHSPL